MKPESKDCPIFFGGSAFCILFRSRLTFLALSLIERKSVFFLYVFCVRYGEFVASSASSRLANPGDADE